MISLVGKNCRLWNEDYDDYAIGVVEYYGYMTGYVCDGKIYECAEEIIEP